MIDYRALDQKWQAAWTEAKIFESNINGDKPYLVTVAFPYVNGPQHIGHMRTFGTADVLARYKRMRGFNVLFPMGFHATGTPILAFAKRIKNSDKELIADLKVFHIPDDAIGKMTDPLYIANYFTGEIENGMHKAGYSIDWRRKFISIDPLFSKFVEWQFGLLNKKGYLVKGKHPIGWCPNENQAVGMHDTKRDVQPEIETEVAVKFKIEGEESYILCATYRPETIFGVTNLFVNKDFKYVLCNIEGQSGSYYISKAASQILKFQVGITASSEISGADLLAKKCTNPVTGASLPIYPGSFVKEDIGTGAVMSVPAHAPFDYAALEKLKKEGYAVDVKPIKVLEIPSDANSEFKKMGNKQEYIDAPALAYISMFGNEKEESEALELATKLSYKEEFHFGKMIITGYEGMSEPDARVKLTKELTSNSKAMEIYILANAPVTCRCGYNVVVNVVEQWFLNYGNKEWKKLAKEAFKGMVVLPEKSKVAFEAAIDWIDLRAVARSQGLGTKFPLDPNYIIESLSDSTIYMSFYTISHLIRAVDVEKLRPEFFDYVFLNVGRPEDVEQSTGIDYQLVKRCRDSFDYWYKMTSRHSGPDLIFNHLTMYIFNHSTIFAKEYWPKQIVVNGSVLSEGEKMSKSLGNIIPLVDALDKYGADVVRTIVLGGADLFSDSEFSEEAAKGVDDRFSYLYDMAGNVANMDTTELRHMDYWLYSKLNRKIKAATEQIEKLELRGVSTGVIYDSILELKKYFSRGTPNGIVVKDYLSAITLMMTPLAPHISEDIWSKLGNTSFASTEKWPSFEESMISDAVEKEEELLESIISDSKKLVAMMKKGGKEPKKVTLIVADEWKRSVTNHLAQSRDIKKLMEILNSDGIQNLGIQPSDKDKAIKYAQQLVKKMNSLRKIESKQEDEFRLLGEAKEYVSSSLKLEVEVENESASKSSRASNAMPQRPSIDISS